MSVSYTHLDVYKRQAQGNDMILMQGETPRKKQRRWVEGAYVGVRVS